MRAMGRARGARRPGEAGRAVRATRSSDTAAAAPHSSIAAEQQRRGGAAVARPAARRSCRVAARPRAARGRALGNGPLRARTAFGVHPHRHEERRVGLGGLDVKHDRARVRRVGAQREAVKVERLVHLRPRVLGHDDARGRWRRHEAGQHGCCCCAARRASGATGGVSPRRVTRHRGPTTLPVAVAGR